MMVDLKVMAYFKISLSTRNWDRAFFMSDASLLMEAVKKINGMKAPYGTFLVH
ncbi:hypothetical protein [Aeromonas veronii]|uniref:hypothetical protein n=1 Tax=Aeromonas veronii TaxID=654 RepID=UPI001FD6F669|nr:hypothetical protein [Aeromonas veronii]MCJ8216945.1 hypothetical protein [Aeromonas veronii]